MEKKSSVLKIEAIYALVQGSFWTEYCAIAGFAAVYLTYKGLNNTQIGLATSLSGIIGIIFQLFVSNYSDHHMNVPIKRIISIIFVIAIAAGMLLHFVNLPVGMMILMYAVMSSMNASNNGFLNAQLVQFNNVGIPARYGWPRGVGSILYAIGAFVYGKLIEEYSAGILVPISIIGTAICIIAVLCMPNPYKGLDPSKYGAGGSTEKISYLDMLRGNKALIVYLVCVILMGAGQSSGFTFMIRVVEGLGGGTAEYGITEFVRAGVELPMLLISPVLMRKYSCRNLLIVSFITNGLRIWLAAIAPSLIFIYGISILNILCSGIFVFASVLYVNSIVGPREKVRAQSLVVLCQSFGSIIGNTYGGFMIDIVGLRWMLISAGSIIILAGIIMLASEKNS